MITFTENITLTKIECGECGGTYAITERFQEQRKKAGGGWHCPYCECSWGYFENNENTLLKRKLAEKENQLQASKCETLSARRQRDEEAAAKASAERKLSRVRKGFCPCCKRSFQNLQRHMAAKHPEAK